MYYYVLQNVTVAITIVRTDTASTGHWCAMVSTTAGTTVTKERLDAQVSFISVGICCCYGLLVGPVLWTDQDNHILYKMSIY